MVTRLFFLSICFPLLLTPRQQSKKMVEFVDYASPLMGTESTFAFSHGNIYPVVAVPWGMNFWSPQTGENSSGWMYTHTDSLMCGSRQTHQPSPWINDYGTSPIMLLAGELKMSHKERLAPSPHRQEKATPYNYSVTFNSGLQTSPSATSRGVVFEVSFPEKEDQYVVVDVYNGGSSITIESEKRLIKGATRYNNGGMPDNFVNYFMAESGHPAIEYGTYNGDILLHYQTDVVADYTYAYLKFDVPAGEKLTIRAASSFISPEQTAINFNHEIADVDVQLISRKAREQWNNYLGRVEAEGGTDEQFRTFYSCLYRTLPFPRESYEFDSQGNSVYYNPYNGNVHDGYMYTDNGFRDMFRAVYPLFILLYPEVSERVTQSIVNAYNESGFMPEWASPGHRSCMIGNNSVSLLVDIWMKGVQTADAEKALEAMIHQIQARHAEIASVGRDGFGYYDKLGYAPYPEAPEATVETFEYVYADWYIVRFVQSLGKQNTADRYYQEVRDYRNLYYPEHGFMWTKDAKGDWCDCFDATEWGGPFTEGSSRHWTRSVFHDLGGSSEPMGEHEPMVARLNPMSVAPNTRNHGTYGFAIHEIAEMVALDIGQYAHGNQPVQHAIYLYDYIGQPWKIQYHFRNVMDKLCNSGSKGYCGDEDNGQTSTWYVSSAMGFYPVCPEMPEYTVDSSLPKKVTLHLPEGKNFVVSAADNTADCLCIRRALLNGQESICNYLTRDELEQGRELNLSMDSVPNQQRDTQPADFPYSYSKQFQ